MLKKIVIWILIMFVTSDVFQKTAVNNFKINNAPDLYIDNFLIAGQLFLTRVVNNLEKMEKLVLVEGEE